MPRLTSRAALVVLGAVLAVAPPAAAARRAPAPTVDDTTTSTTASTTTTTATPPSTTTTSPPSTSPPPGDPGAGGDVTGGLVPDVTVAVPPPDDPDAGPRVPNVAIVGDLSSAQARLTEAEARVEAADALVDSLDGQIVDLDDRIAALTEEERRAVARVEESRQRLADRAVNAYVRGNLGDLEATFAADDPNEASRNAAMMESVLTADDEAVDDFRAARRQVAADLVDLGERRAAVQARAVEAKDQAKHLRVDVRDARVQLLAFEAGSSIFVTGMVFPVGEPHDYIDSWLAPRSGGRQHQGIDIFATAGTNLFAVERGVITKVGTNSLGGIKLWLYGESGTTYYYAHLLRYAPGIRDGLVVDAGDVVGYVGNTGNAATTPSHLHFEIHPNNGPAVNPTPLLRVVDTLDEGGIAPVARR